MLVPDASVFPFRAAVVALRVCGAETKGQCLAGGYWAIPAAERDPLHLVSLPHSDAASTWLPRVGCLEFLRGSSALPLRDTVLYLKVGAGGVCEWGLGGHESARQPTDLAPCSFRERDFNEEYRRRPAPPSPENLCPQPCPLRSEPH